MSWNPFWAGRQKRLKLILRNPFDAADPCQRICQRLTKLHLKIFLTDIFGINWPNNKVFFLFFSLLFLWFLLHQIWGVLNIGPAIFVGQYNIFSKRGAIRNQRDVKLNFIFSSMCPLCSTWQKGGLYAMHYKHFKSSDFTLKYFILLQTINVERFGFIWMINQFEKLTICRPDDT